MRVLLQTAALTACLGSAVWAEPLDRGQVAADAKWLAHIDFDAAKNTKTAQRVHDRWLGLQQAKWGLQLIRSTTGMDLARDLHSISAYGTRFVPQSGVVIVRAKVDRQSLLNLLEREPSYRTSTYGDYTLHNWQTRKDDPQASDGKQTLTGCFYGPELIVLGQDAAEVRTAIDVLDGDAPGLAGGDSPLSANVPPGTAFEAKVTGLADLAEAEVPFVSPLAHQCRFLALAAGEHEDKVFVQARYEGRSTEVATRVGNIVQGLRALAELQHGDNENAMAALGALKVTVAEKTVTVDWRMPADVVIELIEDEWDKRHNPNGTQ
ncbi:MAG: hypothetical protein JXB62_12605 [Pirellulales bacterium]|nr:hypothetical protein [Pirellulales bacterium]